MSDIGGKWQAITDRHALIRFVDACLRGAGQVMFQNNPLSGLLILIAVFVGAAHAGTWYIGLGAVVGVIVGTAAALALDADTASYRQGMFGFSPLLTGIAVLTFLPQTAWSWALLIVGAAVTTVVTLAFGNLLKTWGVPALTFPFVLTSWFLLLAAFQFHRIGTGALAAPALPEAVGGAAAHATIDAQNLSTSMLNGVSQVYLIGSWISGIIILVALAVNSRWAALFAVVGTVASTLIALAVGAEAAMIDQGLFGFSAVLTAIALGCVYYRPSAAVAGFALLGIVFTLIVQAALDTMLAPLGISSLTAPFVFATWIFLFPKRNFAPTPHHERLKDGVVDTGKNDY